LGGLASLDTPEIRGEIETALKTTLAFELQGVDHLCCGNLGRTELLMTAAQRLGRDDLWEVARQQAASIAGRAEKNGTFLLHHLLPQEVHNPGFFTGSAGIGYQLLRLAYPERVPSVLLWE
jgi:lantibiotic modifying enzyme